MLRNSHDAASKLCFSVMEIILEILLEVILFRIFLTKNFFPPNHCYWYQAILSVFVESLCNPAIQWSHLSTSFQHSKNSFNLHQFMKIMVLLKFCSNTLSSSELQWQLLAHTYSMFQHWLCLRVTLESLEVEFKCSPWRALHASFPQPRTRR